MLLPVDFKPWDEIAELLQGKDRKPYGDCILYADWVNTRPSTDLYYFPTHINIVMVKNKTHLSMVMNSWQFFKYFLLMNSRRKIQ